MSLYRTEAQSTAATSSSSKIRVLLVDDSAVIRGMVKKWLEESDKIDVVGSASDGERAVAEARATKPDVVVLDVEMPRMDGMTALPKILEVDPSIRVVMSSTLTQRNADISLRAMEMGAADYVAKPTARSELHSANGFRQDLLDKIVALGNARQMRPSATVKPIPSSDHKVGAKARPASGLYGAAPIVLRKPSLIVPSIITIGSSTGGPQALMKVMAQLNGKIRQPVLITQHMPATFTTILAQHITKSTGWTCSEACDGEPVVAGRAYLAPGDHHMIVEAGGDFGIIRVNQDPPENFCRPAVDPLFRSLAATSGSKVLGVVLTGMGHDGLNGGQALVQAGSTIIAQDEATSVVWGMPGAVATGGLCSAVLPLDSIADAIIERAGGRRT